MPACEHADFRASVAVNRLSERGGGPVRRFQADLKIECAECGEKFFFLGVFVGRSFRSPRVSIDGTELRIPIRPQGKPQLATKATFGSAPEGKLILCRT